MPIGRPSRSPKRHQPKKGLINIRRGESGGRAVGRAFRVARVPVHLASMLEKHDHLPTPRATLKALPSPHHPPSPLRIARPPVCLPGLG